MKYKVRAILIIDPTETVTINQIKDFLVANKVKFLKVNENMISSISVEKCYHDQIPSLPCEVIFNWQKEF